MDAREEEAAGVSAAVALWLPHTLHHMLPHIIPLHYSPSAATLTDFAAQLVRKEEEEEEEEEVRIYGGRLGWQEKGRRKMQDQVFENIRYNECVYAVYTYTYIYIVYVICSEYMHA